MGKKKRNVKLVNIRALAIMLVVLGHSIILYSDSWNLYTTTRQAPILNELKLIIDHFQMPLFFAVSGFLFFFTERKRGLINLFVNKFQRLMIPYFCVAFLYLLPIRLLIQYPDYMNMSAADFMIKVFTTTDVGHLWYLPALFTIFLIAKCFLMICSKISRYPRINALLLFMFGILLYLEGYKIGIQYPPLLNAYNYLIWFSLGYCLNAFSKLVERIYKHPAVKISLALIWIIFLIIYLRASRKRVIAVLMLRALFITNLFGIIPDQTDNAIAGIDRNSFGLYLFHSPLIYIVFATMPDACPLLVVTINFVIFGCIAYYLTEIIRKLHLGFVIGE